MNNKKEKDKKTSYILTKETMGMTLMLFSAIVLLMLFTGSAVFAGIGKAICTFMYGTFGYGSILIMLVTAYLGEWLVFGKKLKVSLKTALAISLTVFCAFLLFHSAVTRNMPLESYGGYISDCYKNAVNGFSGYTFGGVISAIFVYPFAKLTTYVGALIIFSLFTIASGYLLFVFLRKSRKNPKTAKGTVKVKDTVDLSQVQEEAVSAPPPVVQQPVYAEPVIEREQRIVRNVEAPREQEDNGPYSRKNLGKKILFEKGEFDAESYRRNMIFNDDSYFNHPVHNEGDYLSSFSTGNKFAGKTYSEGYKEEILNQPAVSMPINYVYGEKPIESLEDTDEEVSGGVYTTDSLNNEPIDETPVPVEEEYSRTIRDELSPHRLEEEANESISEPEDTVEEVKESITPVAEERPLERTRERVLRPTEDEEDERHPSNNDDVDMFKLFGSASAARGENRVEPDISRLASRRTERSNVNLFDNDDDDSDDLPSLPKSFTERRAEERKTEPEAKKAEDVKPVVQKPAPAVKPVEPAPAPAPEPPKQEEKPKHVWKKYVRPGIDLLDDYPEHSNVNTAEIEDNKTTITETLAKFKIECEVSNVIIGPAVTRYDVIIEDKTKITQSLKYKEAIAMALRKDNVAAYLNYSKGALSIEVPNNKRTVVGLKSMLTSSKFINCKSNTVTFALGKNVEGEVMCPDITKMPHLLVAGTTGSGKSICLSSLIISLLYKYGPEELRFILVDPKQVEFISYDKLPHLMINEILYDVDKAIKALNWAIKEMERRYSLFKEMTENGIATKNLDEYNSHIPEGEEKLPKIVIILDEFGDLMLQAKKDIESRIIKLVQKARACGIHLILATQRPSVDCITGLIKSNLPTRIGFKVNSFDDSRTIFDIGGAEKLLGKGDMYFRSSEYPDLLRIQGCFVDSHEIQKVTDFIKAHNETYFDQSVSDFINRVEVEETANSMSSDESSGDAGDAKIDETYVKALYYCVTSNQASVSMIQRRFPVGYIKACKIIDWMETMNYITHSEGSKPRKVLLSKDDFIATYGEVDD